MRMRMRMRMMLIIMMMMLRMLPDLGDVGYQHAVRFNPVDVRDLVSTGQKNVIFWNWTQTALSAFHPPRGDDRLPAQ